MKTCKFCGQEYAGYMCACRRRSKRGGRPRSIVSLGSGSRKWNAAQAQARMLGGWSDFGICTTRVEDAEANEANAGDENPPGPECCTQGCAAVKFLLPVITIGGNYSISHSEKVCTL